MKSLARILKITDTMKKLILFMGVIITAISSLSAQMVVDAEMFKANPTQFMGKVVTIKNVVYKGSPSSPDATTGGVVSGTPSATSKPAVGLAGPSAGPAKSAYCNPQPNLTLTKWTLGPNNDICLQVDAKMKPAVDMCQVGKVCKGVSFRVTPTMYLVTRIEP